MFTELTLLCFLAIHLSQLFSISSHLASRCLNTSMGISSALRRQKPIQGLDKQALANTVLSCCHSILQSMCRKLASSKGIEGRWRCGGKQEAEGNLSPNSAQCSLIYKDISVCCSANENRCPHSETPTVLIRCLTRSLHDHEFQFTFRVSNDYFSHSFSRIERFSYRNTSIWKTTADSNIDLL